MTRFTFPKNKHEFVALMKQRSQKERKRLVRYKLSFVIYSAFLAAFTLLGGQMSAQQRPIVWLAVLLGIVVAIVSLMVKTQSTNSGVLPP